MPDLAFSHPRLAALYDVLDGDRSDLDLYCMLVDRYGARDVLDVGCGTGSLAIRLAQRGIKVTGLDPAEASLALARRKCGPEHVQWILGDAASAPSSSFDLATMTGNVGQVYLTDAEWAGALQNIERALRPNGFLLFESRDPADEPWWRWNRAETHRHVDDDGFGRVAVWCDIKKVKLPLVTFCWTYEFERDGEVIVSESTLRFRSQSEIEQSLDLAGYSTIEVLDAPDRPGRELVIVARRKN